MGNTLTGKYVMTLDMLAADAREAAEAMLASDDAEMRKIAQAQMDNTYIEFLPGGTFKLLMADNDGSIEGAFKADGKTITISGSAGGEAFEMTLSVEGNVVSMDMGGTPLRLVKEG